jgi:hypothetical protein
MFSSLFASIADSVRHRFRGSRTPAGENQSGREQPGEPSAYRGDPDALERHNRAEANVVGRTMADDNAIRAFGKGRPR